MKCPKCQTGNDPDANFCEECGAKLEVVCPECGNTIRPGSKFCKHCGCNLMISSEPTPKIYSQDEKLKKIQKYLPKGLTEKILAQKDRIEGERKHVTVMFCDMEGFTALSERLEPEEAYTIMDHVYEILIHKVHDYEGTVNEMTGDGIVALFGAPIALEDAPQRAIRSALAIHRELTKFSDKLRDKDQSIHVKMRIGIHTGPVVVGTVGNDLRVEFKAVGNTVNLASRIEEIAESGTTYITEDTFILTEGLFRFEGLGEREIKGKKKPVKVYRVLAPSSRRTRFDVSSESGLTPFVGRERELELLIDGFERAKLGRGQAFSIVAEAGLGKSRLLYEFRKLISNETVTFLEGKCLSYSRDVAYHPVIDILKTNFDVQGNDNDSEVRNKLKLGLRKIEADESSTLPYFLELLSAKASGTDEISISPDVKRARTMESLRHIVLKGSKRRPLIMAVEDLHWIDRSSEESFKFLLEGIPGARVLLIFTYRPEFIHTWGGRSYHNQVNLNRLSNRESLAMVSYLLGTQNIEKNLEASILDKTEGVPFFIEEFIRSLKDLSSIETKDSEMSLAEDLKDVTIPSRIQDVIMARVDSLPEGSKEILQLGSVVGREFGHDLLIKIVDLNEQDLLSRVSVLKDAELLYETGIYPQTTYIFKHALTQESVYKSLLKSTRQKYHRLIAKTLEQVFPEMSKTQPEILGYHFTEADLPEQAISYWQQAGEMATRRSANIEAIAHLTNGLQLLKTLPENPTHLKQELKLLVEIGPPLTAIKGQASEEIERTYFRARQLCEKVGESQFLPTVLYGLFNYHMTLAEFQICLKYANELLQLANNVQDHPNLIAAHRALGGTLYWLGDLTKARYHIEQAIAYYDPQQHHRHASFYWTDQGLHALSYATIIFWMLGYADQASNMISKVNTLTHKLSHAYSVVMGKLFITFTRCYLREIDKTKESAEDLICYSTENRFPILLGIGEVMRLWALGMQNNEIKIIDEMRRAIEELYSIPFYNIRGFVLCLLAEVCLKLRQIEEGWNTLDESQTWMLKSGERCWEAESYRLKGEMLLSQPLRNPEKAEACFREAIEIASNQKSKSLELRAAMSIGRLWKSQGKNEEARNLLSKIYGWFTEGFDTIDLIEAKVLLGELSSR